MEPGLALQQEAPRHLARFVHARGQVESQPLPAQRELRAELDLGLAHGSTGTTRAPAFPLRVLHSLEETDGTGAGVCMLFPSW